MSVYVNDQGQYLGQYIGTEPPAGAVEVPTAPEDARQVWDFSAQAWGPVPATVPERVTRAQAKIQLYRAGLLEQVETEVQAAGGETLLWYIEAATWERQNPHVLTLASRLGLTDEQVDQLFIDAEQIV